ncbi:MAG TPA: ELWxxDGT repeat protein [Thermoanaerobaculia bacterium]|nr:ELWxxDGT repeat protein [Thermoanaerobaculia bacterium]
MRKPWIVGLAMAALLGASLPGQAQGPVLVRDIATGPTYSPGSYASAPVRFRGEDYFSADDGFLGAELWATNGTQRGTRLVADLCPGRCSGHPWIITRSGDLLYFYAGNVTSGFESYWLWRSDGTAAGTFPLVDLEIGGFGSAGPVSFLAPFQDGVVFIVHDLARRAWSLWGSDGTRAGTHPIAPLPGRFDPTQAPTDSDGARIFDDGRKHYFAWRGRLWGTDGTAAGTGPASTPVRPCGGSARLGRLLVYAGADGAADCEPWVSDGTARGTRLLRDIRQGGSSSYPGGFVAAGDLVYFVAYDAKGRQQLWKTDGTPLGTVVVSAPGSRGLGEAAILGAAGSRVYFVADDREHGVELWRTNGTPASTALVADLTPGPIGTFFTGAGGGLGNMFLFAAAPNGETVSALFRTQGTAASTVRLTGDDFGVEGVLATPGDRVYFNVLFPEGNRELAVSDGTVAGTRVLDLAHPVASSNPHELIAGSAGLVFIAKAPATGTGVWHSAGHAWDTEPFDSLSGYSYDSPVQLEPGSGGAFYSTFDERRFGWTDGQTLREVVPPGTVPSPQSFIDLGNRTLFFDTRLVSELTWQPWIWSSDGTPEGTAPVAAASGDTGGPSSFRFQAALVPATGDVRFVVQKDDTPPPTSTKLWVTDGTAAGTRELVDIQIHRFQNLDQLVAAGRTVFASFWSNSRSSLWASDGTPEGTREVYAINNPWDIAFIYGLTAAGEQAFFLGGDFARGRELWVSDGTQEGTHRIADLAPGAASSDPTDLAAFGDRVLFSADDGTHGRELWVSDGTTEGTRLLEIYPGPRGSFPQAFRVVGDRVVFAADDGVHGLEVWVTDGTPEGTRLAADVTAGRWPSSPREFTVVGDELFFNAGRPRTGYELWKLPLEALEP